MNMCANAYPTIAIMIANEKRNVSITVSRFIFL